MKKTILLFLTGICGMAAVHAQTTSPSPYCHAGFDFIGGGSSDWINSVQLGSLSNISNAECAAPYYIFYNNLPAPDLIRGSSYTLSLNFHIGGGTGYAAWIDFNHNNAFDASERVAWTAASSGMGLGPGVPVTATIAIPASALLGNARMRIRITEDDNYHGTNPGAPELACDSLNTTSYGGETEDYIVNIKPALSVNEIGHTEPFSLYPNPAGNSVTVSGIPGNATVTIFDITGRPVSCFKIKENAIDVSRFNAGTYFVRIATEQAVYTSQLAIQK